MKKCKILCLNGGGVLAELEIHFLAMLPKEQQTLKGVDILAGVSAGALLAAAMATGKSFSEIDDVFQNRAKECFTKRFAAKINPLACPTYRSDTMESVLNDMIGKSATLGSVKRVYPDLNVILPSLNVSDDVYCPFHNLTHEWDHMHLVDLAMASAAAPTYFAGREMLGACYIDAGLIEVDPLLTSTTMAKKYLGVPFMAQRVMMLGSGMDRDPSPMPTKKYNNLSLLSIATDILAEYATLSNKIFTKMCGDGLGLNYWNFWNPVQVEGKIDDVDQIPRLVELADQHKDAFLKAWNEWLNG